MGGLSPFIIDLDEKVTEAVIVAKYTFSATDDILYELKKKYGNMKQNIENVEIEENESKSDINGAYSLISTSSVRNEMILEDTRNCISTGRTPVILTKYKEQAKYLNEHLQEDADHVFLLYGDNSDKENSDVRRKLKEVPKTKVWFWWQRGRR